MEKKAQYMYNTPTTTNYIESNLLKQPNTFSSMLYDISNRTDFDQWYRNSLVSKEELSVFQSGNSFEGLANTSGFVGFLRFKKRIEGRFLAISMDSFMWKSFLSTLESSYNLYESVARDLRKGKVQLVFLDKEISSIQKQIQNPVLETVESPLKTSSNPKSTSTNGNILQGELQSPIVGDSYQLLLSFKSIFNEQKSQDPNPTTFPNLPSSISISGRFNPSTEDSSANYDDKKISTIKLCTEFEAISKPKSGQSNYNEQKRITESSLELPALLSILDIEFTLKEMKVSKRYLQGFTWLTKVSIDDRFFCTLDIDTHTTITIQYKAIEFGESVLRPLRILVSDISISTTEERIENPKPCQSMKNQPKSRRNEWFVGFYDSIQKGSSYSKYQKSNESNKVNPNINYRMNVLLELADKNQVPHYKLIEGDSKPSILMEATPEKQIERNLYPDFGYCVFKSQIRHLGLGEVSSRSEIPFHLKVEAKPLEGNWKRELRKTPSDWMNVYEKLQLTRIIKKPETLLNTVESWSCCLVLQSALKKLDPQILHPITTNEIFKIYLPIITKLSCNPSGNFTIQLLIKKLNVTQRLLILNRIKDDFVELICNPKGIYVLQVLIDLLENNVEKGLFFSCLFASIQTTIKNPQAGFVYQKIIRVLDESYIRILWNRIEPHLLEICCQKFGVCVVKLLMDRLGSNREAFREMVKRLIPLVSKGKRNSYFNFGIQHLIETAEEKDWEVPEIEEILSIYFSPQQSLGKIKSYSIVRTILMTLKFQRAEFLQLEVYPRIPKLFSSPLTDQEARLLDSTKLIYPSLNHELSLIISMILK